MINEVIIINLHWGFSLYYEVLLYTIELDHIYDPSYDNM